MNREKGFLEDQRVCHKTNPPTRWFIASTDRGRILKIVFIEREDGKLQIKTAYQANSDEVNIYEKHG